MRLIGLVLAFCMTLVPIAGEAQQAAKVYRVRVLYPGVDNAIFEMDASEPPIGDGSATPYVELIKKAGIEFVALPPEDRRKIDRMRDWFSSPEYKNRQTTRRLEQRPSSPPPGSL